VAVAEAGKKRGMNSLQLIGVLKAKRFVMLTKEASGSFDTLRKLSYSLQS
jgi:hypothetical protein